jgi:hypothetical protein
MTVMKSRLVAIFLLLAGTAGMASLAVTPAEAGRLKLRLPPPMFDMAQGFEDENGEFGGDPAMDNDISIRPREAARIARETVPGAKVLNVRLLPSGVYAVTLRGDGKLTRVMVDGRSGDIL